MLLFDREELRAFLSQSRQEHLDATGDRRQAERLTRRAFLSWLDDFIAPLREEVASLSDLDPAGRAERVDRARRDFHFFRRTYFPHYYQLAGESKLQSHLRTVYDRIRDKSDAQTSDSAGEKFAVAAPRGFGKSTDVALAFILWVVAYELKYFLPLFSDAVELTEVEIEAIKAELEENARLRQDFPHIAGAGSVWRVGDIVTANNIRIKGFGSGKRVRGIKHGTRRPDLVIIDDLENDENVRSRRQRDKLESWLDSALENLGGVDDRMDILYIGTILHRDAVLARKLKLAYWNPRIFRALVRFPARMDLWDVYESLYRTKSAAKAHAYYLKHRTQMDTGARLLWSAVTLESLMKKRIASRKAFEKEQQNNPGSEFGTFDSAKFTVISPTQAPPLVKKFLYTDFKGDSVVGDYFAVTAGGFDAEGKKLYVYYSHRAQIKGLKAVNFLVDLYEQEQFYLIGGERNGGFYLYRDWFKDKAIEQLGLIPNTRFIHNHEKKEERIAELEFPLDAADPDIIFVGEHPELFAELDDFPEALHDDLSDTLAGLWRLARLKRRSTPRTHRRGTVRPRSTLGHQTYR